MRGPLAIYVIPSISLNEPHDYQHVFLYSDVSLAAAETTHYQLYPLADCNQEF